MLSPEKSCLEFIPNLDQIATAAASVGQRPPAPRMDFEEYIFLLLEGMRNSQESLASGFNDPPP